MVTSNDRLEPTQCQVTHTNGPYNLHCPAAGHQPPVRMKCLHGYFFRLLDRLVCGICSEEVQSDMESRREVDSDGSSSMSCGPWDRGADRCGIFF
jgi:hypothetical protein